MILAGVCLLVNKKARTAATCLGLTILLTVLWIYLPILLPAPTDVVALNFFFDAVLFCGTILLLANSIDKEAGRLTARPLESRKSRSCEFRGGVFEVLEQRQITPQIESVAGTSAGAITADPDSTSNL